MAKRPSKPARAKKRGEVKTPENRAYLEALRVHRRVLEGADRDAKDLPAGVTHVLTEQEDGPPLLVEKRKSFF